MRLISYSINIDDFQNGKQTPILKYSGVYPSEAFNSPQELAQSIVDVLNEEFDLEMTVETAMKIKEIYIGGEFLEIDSVSIKDRQERIDKNKKELGFPE